MKTYDIIVEKRGVERHSTNAASPKQALANYEEGLADIKDDENTAVDSVRVIDRLTGEDVTPDDDADDEPEVKEYSIRIGVTVRAFAEETFEAASWEEAIEKAKAYDPNDFHYSYEPDQGFDGDEIAYLREADDEMSDDHEVDLRPDGEPYSWVACDIVKKLAAIDISDDQAIANIIGEARTACSRETVDDNQR